MARQPDASHAGNTRPSRATNEEIPASRKARPASLGHPSRRPAGAQPTEAARLDSPPRFDSEASWGRSGPERIVLKRPYALFFCLLSVLALAACGGGAQEGATNWSANLSQEPGTAGCISENGTGGLCQNGKGLRGDGEVAVSPDGKNVYVTSFASGSVAIFDRDLEDGTLKQKAGLAGCIAEGGKDAIGDSCQKGRALRDATGVVVSADGKSVYVASGSGAVAIFQRASNTGALSQDPGTAGCISDDDLKDACQRGKALKEAAGVAVSPDGKSVYVASEGFNAVAIFNRNTATGALTQKPGRAGCIAEGGAGGVCQQGKALGGAAGVAVSPDGKSVYVSSLTSNGVAIFHRDLATGALKQAAGAAGCISEPGRKEGCQDGSALKGPLDIAISPDGKNVYSTAANSDALVTFDRNPATGALTQNSGTTGCISSGGSGGACQKGRALSTSFELAVAPDGKSVYATASDFGAGVVLLRRDLVTGVLSQKPGPAGCITENGNGGTCQKGRALQITSGLAVSPDSRNLYVIAGVSEALAIFGR